MRYEGDIYRPPGEWRSYLLQCTVGCSYNGCTYCGMYKNKQYHVRPLADILEDIDMAREHFTDFGSFPLGMPSVTRVFLCDGDAIAMDTDDLLTILAPALRGVSPAGAGDHLCRTHLHPEKDSGGVEGAPCGRAGSGLFGGGDPAGIRCSKR